MKGVFVIQTTPFNKDGSLDLETACPFCLINIEDSIESVNVKDLLKVKDLTELMLYAIEK